MTHTTTTYSRQQLIDALSAEYAFLCHDDFDPDVDMTASQHLDYLNAMSNAELIAETCTDEENPLSEFIYAYS